MSKSVTDNEIRRLTIRSGVRSLRTFGYPSCNGTNILTDRIYKQFFRGILEETVGQAGEQVDRVLKQLLEEIAL